MKVKIVIENLNKSNNMKPKFINLKEDIMNTSLKLPNDCRQHWTSTDRLLERVLNLWMLLRAHYFQLDMDYPLANSKEKILQLYYLLMGLLPG